MNFFKWMICKHEYKIIFFKSPTREIVNLTCIHCGQEIIHLLCKGWDLSD